MGYTLRLERSAGRIAGSTPVKGTKEVVSDWWLLTASKTGAMGRTGTGRSQPQYTPA